MILGIGIDLVPVSKVERELDRDPDWCKNVFTPLEIDYCVHKHHPAQHFAARFAAKEALFKALPGDAPRGQRWRDVEVSRQPSGQPVITLSGCLAAYAATLPDFAIHLSISHTADLAVAVVVLESFSVNKTSNHKEAE